MPSPSYFGNTLAPPPDVQLASVPQNFQLTPPGASSSDIGSLNLGNYAGQLNLNGGTSSAASSGMGMMMGASAISAVGGMVSGIFGYLAQKTMMDAQLKMAKANYAHQDTMAQIDKKMSLTSLAAQDQKTQMQVDGQKKLDAAQEEQQKATNDLSYVQAEEKEWKLTQKTTALNTKVLDQTFNRKPYNYGTVAA